MSTDDPKLEHPAATPGLIRDRPAALIALGLGVVAMIVATTAQLLEGQMFSVNPDLRLTMPFFLATLIAAVASLARREKAFAMSIGGLGLACAALALGWVLALAIVAVVAGIVIYVLSEVF